MADCFCIGGCSACDPRIAKRAREYEEAEMKETVGAANAKKAKASRIPGCHPKRYWVRVRRGQKTFLVKISHFAGKMMHHIMARSSRRDEKVLYYFSEIVHRVRNEKRIEELQEKYYKRGRKHG